MEENQQANPSTAAAVEVQEKNTHPQDGIDFGSIRALANTDYEVEPRWKTIGYGIIEKLISLGLFLLGFALDILKTLWVIVKGLFVGIYKGILAIGRFFRNVARLCGEGDRYVKLSTVASGLGNIKGGQVVDGVIFMVAELAFILYMALFGGTAIYNLIYLGEEARGVVDQPDLWLNNNDSIKFLISGILTIIVIVAYFFVWYSGLKAAHDNYIIRNNFRFMQAHADQVETVENNDKYTDFFDVVEGTDENGKPYSKLVYKKPKEIRRIAKEVYGFPDLSARYISYVPFNHLQERPIKGLPKLILKFKQGFYNKYDKVRVKIRNGKWSSIFAKYLEWEFLPPASKYGYDVVRTQVVGGFNKFRHTYDKYNDYLSYTRDASSLLKVLKDPELLEKAIYAEDPVSVQNGLEPVPAGSLVKPKVAASRIIGAFECSYADAVTAATYYHKALKEQPKTNMEPKERIRAIEANLQERLDNFVRINSVELKAGVNQVKELYLNGRELLDIYAQGEKTFRENVKKDRYISDFDARDMQKNIAYAKKVYGSDDEVIEYLHRCGENYGRTVERFETYPFHGQPMHFKKKAKQYLDEKFAVTVMTLPVLGALITSVLPLLISIVVAFTNYTGANAITGIFDWNMDSWVTMFSSTDSSLMGPTFVYILGWTLVWALFATFTNYILGIVLALLINKKSIKLKKVYRMFFVISIAIPQFITLLAMSKILGPGGPINQMVYDAEFNAHAEAIKAGTYAMTTRLDTWWLNDPANQGLSAKICLILVNVWIGIPYTMLSTSGILMNIPEDLYESSRIDGASPWTQFWKITMPYILFVTGPSLLTTFIGNINNFNVIYFLTGGGPKPASIGELNLDAGYTDLLITFLFKITVNSATHQYSLGSVIGILVFAICAFFSLIMYSRMGSTQNEEAFQ